MLLSSISVSHSPHRGAVCGRRNSYAATWARGRRGASTPVRARRPCHALYWPRLCWLVGGLAADSREWPGNVPISRDIYAARVSSPAERGGAHGAGEVTGTDRLGEDAARAYLDAVERQRSALRRRPVAAAANRTSTDARLACACCPSCVARAHRKLV